MDTSLQGSQIQSKTAAHPGIPYPELRRCLSFDLEITVEDNSLLAAAAYRPDTGDSLSLSGSPNRGSLQRLEQIAEGAGFLLGHKSSLLTSLIYRP